MKIFSAILAVCLFSCALPKNIGGTYQAYCTLYHLPEAQVILNENKTFLYKFIYNEDKIEGTWTINSDSLILKSAYFLVKVDSMSPIRKLTDLSKSKDVFLVKGKKLLPVMKKGLEKTCVLTKTKKPIPLPGKKLVSRQSEESRFAPNVNVGLPQLARIYNAGFLNRKVI
jgi:hypothetical protein